MLTYDDVIKAIAEDHSKLVKCPPKVIADALKRTCAAYELLTSTSEYLSKMGVQLLFSMVKLTDVPEAGPMLCTPPELSVEAIEMLIDYLHSNKHMFATGSIELRRAVAAKLLMEMLEK